MDTSTQNIPQPDSATRPDCSLGTGHQHDIHFIAVEHKSGPRRCMQVGVFAAQTLRFGDVLQAHLVKHADQAPYRWGDLLRCDACGARVELHFDDEPNAGLHLHG